ncbi:class I SAM-dependent methyltransferase [uncultured Pseudodesulfovibrio sp.]|uniref:class I SAM-dependent methyltransferase n=1 Tax=uncultured Pseudodesulfovibrio sp. TaxID=2035858 RepID=UPI0029C6E00D|nr:class I SAM-dependent methyltransferase [uncultured Pseudodesulfovibrio sp.]
MPARNMIPCGAGLGTRLGRFFRGVSTLRHWMGLGGTRLGFYIPYRWAGSLSPFTQNDCYEWLKEAWDADRAPFEDTLSLIEKYIDRLADFAVADPENVDRPRFDQSWFPGLDGAAAYTMVRELSPARIIEIGSGHSTRFMAQAIRDGGLSTRLTSIDPVPRRGIDHLCDEVVRTTLDKADLAVFRELSAGDILFFDGSHIGMPGSDADTLINRVLPVLAPGVRVHIHDIFLPNGYPDIWEWRGYNEQLLAASLLAGGDRFRVRFASAYVRRYMSDYVAGWPIPLPDECFEASLWLEKTA